MREGEEEGMEACNLCEGQIEGRREHDNSNREKETDRHTYTEKKTDTDKERICTVGERRDSSKFKLTHNRIGKGNSKSS